MALAGFWFCVVSYRRRSPPTRRVDPSPARQPSADGVAQRNLFVAHRNDCDGHHPAYAASLRKSGSA